MLERTTQGSETAPKGTRDGAQRHPRRTKLQGAFNIHAHPWSPQSLPPAAGDGQSGPDPLDQNGALELGERRNKVQHQLARRGRRIEGLACGNESDPELSELLDRPDHVAQAAEQAIGAPNKYRVEASLPSVPKQAVELGAPLPSAADAMVDVRVDDLPTTRCRQMCSLVVLQLRILIQLRNP